MVEVRRVCVGEKHRAGEGTIGLNSRPIRKIGRYLDIVSRRHIAREGELELAIGKTRARCGWRHRVDDFQDDRVRQVLNLPRQV